MVRSENLAKLLLPLVVGVLCGCAGIVSQNTSGNTTVMPAIATQPTNQTVAAGQSANFSVVASGTAPLTFQWRKNSTNISGATAASYATPATTTSDNGRTFDSGGSANDFHAAYESDRDGGPDCDIHSRCHGYCAPDVSVEKEWNEYFGRDGFDLHHACDNDRG